MSKQRLDELLERQSLRPLLPALYIVWADMKLEDEERSHLRELGEALVGKDAELHGILDQWTDPSAPPSTTELAQIRSLIVDQVGDVRGSLTDIAEHLSDSMNGDTREALRTYESRSGILGVGVSAALFRSRGEGVVQEFKEGPPSFEPGTLSMALEGGYRDAWERVRTIVSDETYRFSGAVTTEDQRKEVLEWLLGLAEEGLGFEAMPESVGGADRMPYFIHIFEALSMFDLSLVVKFGVQYGLFGGSIIFLGTDKHHQKYLEDIANCKLLGGFAMTESGHGSNVRSIETMATYDPDSEEFVINSPTMSSRKEWIGNAARDGQMMTVFAQLETGGKEYGVHAFVVPIRTADGDVCEGVRIEDCGHKMGLNGVDNGRLYFEHVRIPRENLLDRYASVTAEGDYESPISSDNKRFFTMLGTLVGGRVSVAASAVTAAKKALTIAIRYGVLRRQFGAGDGREKRIMDYKTHQLRLLPALAKTYALHFAAYDLIEQYKERTEENTREVETLAAGIKAKATWHAIEATQMARECCGGLGYLTENQISIVLRDVDIFATFEGDNTVLMQLLAKNKLSSYAEEFEQDLVMTVIKELTRRAKSELIDTNPVIVRETDEEHLRDASFHQEILKMRAHNLLVAAARRIRKRIEQGVDPFEAFSEVQDHLMAYAHAEMDSSIAETFATRVEAMDEGPEQEALERMRQLAAIDTIYEKSGWYLENGYIHVDKSRALRKLRMKLLGEIRPDVIGYTDAFNIPDTCLSAAIAYEDYIGGKPRGAKS